MVDARDTKLIVLHAGECEMGRDKRLAVPGLAVEDYAKIRTKPVNTIVFCHPIFGNAKKGSGQWLDFQFVRTMLL